MTRGWIEAAQARGEMRADADPEVLIDLLYGTIYYRLLVEHQPLDAAFGSKLVDDVLALARP